MKKYPTQEELETIAKASEEQIIPYYRMSSTEWAAKWRHNFARHILGWRDAQVPEGYKLLKDTTCEERSWSEDSGHENGNYFNTCCHCGREFVGHKRRGVCKVCATISEESK